MSCEKTSINHGILTYFIFDLNVFNSYVLNCDVCLDCRENVHTPYHRGTGGTFCYNFNKHGVLCEHVSV